MTWDKVDGALLGAKALAWDGCHKIYLAMDEPQAEQFKAIGYGQHEGGDTISQFVRFEQTVPGRTAARQMLDAWWDASCGLRFISAVTTDPRTPAGELGEFENLIAQFELDDEEPGEYEERPEDGDGYDWEANQ